MRRILTVLLVLAVAIVPAVAGGAGESSGLMFGTGGDQGTYYGYGNVLAARITSETPTSVTAVVSAGSQDNIEMMDMGRYQLGFVQTDVMSYAYNGTNLFAETGAIDGFSTVSPSYSVHDGSNYMGLNSDSFGFVNDGPVGLCRP